MDSWVNRVLRKVIPVREDETTVALLMFAYSFLAMTAHNILKPVTEVASSSTSSEPTTCRGWCSRLLSSSAC